MEASHPYRYVLHGVLSESLQIDETHSLLMGKLLLNVVDLGK